jgi:hypothetical protein
MKKDILEFIKREIKNFYFLFYWFAIISIVNWGYGFEKTVIVALAYIISKILYGGNK